MDKVTPEAFTTFLWVGAAIVAFVLLLWNLADKFKAARKPKDDLKEWQQATDTKLAADKKRIDALENGQKVTLRSISALLSHEINGNSVDKMQKSYNEIMDYLIER